MVERVYTPVPFAPKKELIRVMVYFPDLAEPGKTDPISSARMAWYLRSRIHFDAVYDQKNRPPEIPGKIHELWVVNSSWVYMDQAWRIDSTRLFPVADKVIFCNNDYAMVLHSYHLGRIRPDARYVVLSTVPKVLEKAPGDLVNWNVLTYDPRPIAATSARSGLYYYGSFRAGRRPVFDRLLEGFGADLAVSPSNVRSARLFKETYPGLRLVPRAPSVVDELRGHLATLLLEDDFSIESYVSPPNRFYEALSAPCAMLFERRSVPMWKRYGYDVEPYSFATPAEALALARDGAAIGAAQAAAWRRDYLAELDLSLTRARAGVERGTIGRLGPPPGQKLYATPLNVEGPLPTTGIRLNLTEEDA